MRRLAVLLIGFFVAASADAQIWLTGSVPTNPVAGVPFLLKVSESVCSNVVGVTVHGTFVDLIWNPPVNCIQGERTQQVPVPALTAGTYTIRVLSTFNNSVVKSAPLIVGADIPALDPSLLSFLAVALILIAAMRLRA